MRAPLLILNFKNYLEIGADGCLKLAMASDEVSKELQVEIAVAPPNPALALVASKVSIPVIAQHVDPTPPGGKTGWIVPEILKSFGVSGSLVNHSERRLEESTVAETVKALKRCGMTSVVCAATPEEAGRLARYGPEFVAMEPPELIGSGVAISKARPEVITESVDQCRRADLAVQPLCGAGVVSGEDVAAAMKLGSRGILVASGVVKASDWKAKLTELSRPLREY